MTDARSHPHRAWWGARRMNANEVAGEGSGSETSGRRKTFEARPKGGHKIRKIHAASRGPAKVAAWAARDQQRRLPMTGETYIPQTGDVEIRRTLPVWAIDLSPINPGGCPRAG